jgi:hypothetical protein
MMFIWLDQKESHHGPEVEVKPEGAAGGGADVAAA